jgi:hypothetical protein
MKVKRVDFEFKITSRSTVNPRNNRRLFVSFRTQDREECREGKERKVSKKLE